MKFGIRDLHIMLFREIPCREDRTFLMGVNETTFTRVP